MSWTVGELARSARVTVRTLHHYDAAGLRLHHPKGAPLVFNRTVEGASTHGQVATATAVPYRIGPRLVRLVTG